jgi:hypothetical protein
MYVLVEGLLNGLLDGWVGWTDVLVDGLLD